MKFIPTTPHLIELGVTEYLQIRRSYCQLIMGTKTSYLFPLNMLLKGEKLKSSKRFRRARQKIKIKTKGNWQAKGINIEWHYNLA